MWIRLFGAKSEPEKKQKLEVRSVLELNVENHITGIVGDLKRAGYTAYVVGGAVRDLLLGRTPKDYDISTSATPEEVRDCFGRRRARIIGKRFRLVHLRCGGEIIEISTFRSRPGDRGAIPGPIRNKSRDLPKNMIFDDNEFGSPEEDAFRRDFTVNALFYDPTEHVLLDYTGRGLEDIRRHIVRVIGDPKVRFEEDPVRLLRALKLVGQYDFELEPATENALFACLPLIKLASPSRLALELEKIMASPYGDLAVRACHDYGLLKFYLPFMEERFGTPAMNYAMELWACRNQRVREGAYRNSTSVLLALLALPFVEERGGRGRGELWAVGSAAHEAIAEMTQRICAPHNMIKMVRSSAERILALQPLIRNGKKVDKISGAHGYAHALEIFKIQNQLTWHDPALLEPWPEPRSERPRREIGDSDGRGGRHKRNFRHGKRSGRRPESKPDFSAEE